MERSFPAAHLVVAAVALIVAFGGGVAATASADPGDPVDEMGQMHAEMHASHDGMGMRPHAAEMDQMHAEMSARLSPENRARHERMHEACRGLLTERRER